MRQDVMAKTLTALPPEKEVDKQIRELMDSNPDLQTVISELRKAKVRGSWESMKGPIKKSSLFSPLTFSTVRINA